MAKNSSERTLKMKQDFIELRKSGLSIRAIAEKFNLNPKTVYDCLDEIATAAGVTRESLLYHPHSPHQGYYRHDYQSFTKVNLAEHQHFVQETCHEFDHIIANIDSYIAVQQEIQSEEGEKYVEYYQESCQDQH